MLKRKILAAVLAVGLLTTFGSTELFAKERFVKPIKRARIAAGEVLAYNTRDTYIDIRDIANIDESKLLQLSGFEASYAITGSEATYYTESALDAAGLEALLTKRIEFNVNDLANLKSSTKVGHYVIKGTYTNQEVIDAGHSGKVNFEINVNVIDSKVSVYDENPATSPVGVLHVHNFELALANAKNFDANTAKAVVESQFKAWDSSVVGGSFNGGKLEPGKNIGANVTIDATDLNNIKNAKDAGAYPLKYTLNYYDNNTISKTVTVFVSDKNTVIDRSQELVIFAKDFTIDIETAKVATPEQIMELAQPKVYDYFTGNIQDSSKITIDVTGLRKTANNIVTTKADVNSSEVKEEVISIEYNDGAKNIKTSAKASISYTIEGTDPTGPGDDDDDDDNVITVLPKTGMDSLHFSLITLIFGVISYLGYSYKRR